MRWLFRIAVLFMLMFAVGLPIAFMQSAQLPPAQLPPLNIPSDLIASTGARIALQYYADTPQTWITDENGELVPVAPDFVWYTESFLFAWSPDCERFAFTGASPDDVRQSPMQRLWVGDYGSDTFTPVSPVNSEGSASGMVWSPSGSAIAYPVFSQGIRELFVANLETGDTLPIDLPDGRIAGWLDETRLIVYTVERLANGDVNRDDYLATWVDGEFRLAPLDGEYSVVYPNSAQQDRFAARVFDADRARSDLNLYALDGTLLRELARDVQSTGIYWSPDGSLITVTERSGTPLIVNADSGEQTPIQADPPIVYIDGWSADGSSFFYQYAGFTSMINRGLALYQLADASSKSLIEPPPDDYLVNWAACIP